MLVQATRGELPSGMFDLAPNDVEIAELLIPLYTEESK
jgi:hypothetical protein